jgi:serine protease inhibitor
MKFTHCLSALFLFAVLGCSAESREPAEPGTPEPGPGTRETPRGFTVQEARLADASVGFGLRLYQQVSTAETKPNLLVSPLSASMALGMALNGANNTTLDAMRSALGFGTLTEAEVNQAYKGLIAQLLARDAKIEFNLANSLWHERTFTVNQPFIDAARNFFDAEVTALNFRDAASPRVISTWAENETGGRIKDLITSIDPAEILFLVNAVYFKAPWSTPFDPRSTRDAAFTREDGSTVNVPTMMRDGSFRWFRNNDVIALELPYADSAFSMVIMLPAAGRALAPLHGRLNTTWWQTVMDSVRSSRVMVFLPKFKFEYAKKLNDPLSAMGMAIAFDKARADFYRIADVRPERIYISRVEHKTFIDVHELGTEAAAATAVGFGVTSLPPTLEFNRPFLFAIRERSSGAILFIGRVGDPSQK